MDHTPPSALMAPGRLGHAPRVWLATAPAEVEAAPASWFSESERDRWASLGAHRRPEFWGSRLMLRELLAASGGGELDQWLLDSRGRPLDHGNAAGLCTSISHQGRQLAVACCASAGGMGIDLEAPDRRCRWQKIARRYFSPREQALLGQAEPDRAASLFFRLWTVKEAWVKATGRGLAGNFQAIRMLEANARGWALQGDTENADWQVWTGMVGSAFLAVIWQGAAGDGPAIQPVTLGAARCTPADRLRPASVWQVTLRPGA